MSTQLRTSERMAIALAVTALIGVGVAVLAGSQLEKAFNSTPAATVLLVLWCLTGVGAAIAALVDAYVKPDGEELGYWVTVAATTFAVLSLLALVGIALGASGVTDTKLS